MSDSPHPTNRLAEETSPYLQQHAANPVDWYPWGEEAFGRARELDRPIFLSIGYSACHWCHVMERESFEDEEIAGLLNEKFVAIKVDREERPDLDQIYMNAVQLLTRRGGWPMSVFLTPDARPFFGGTYWPPRSAMGMPGFADIVVQVAEAWTQRRDELEHAAGELTEAVGRMGRPEGTSVPLEVGLIEKARRQLLASADRRHGGFGNAPKFLHSMDLRLLLRCYRRFEDEESLAVALLTLGKMAGGGLYDHLRGGFHRYSTDAVWLVPHFEKMLYDNALLVPAYLEAWQATGEKRYAEIVRETLEYVLAEMTGPDGQFYSTQDADSEGVEGKFFVWSDAEVREVLGEAAGEAVGEEAAETFCACYEVSEEGNWEGANILNRATSHEQAAETLGVAPDVLAGQLAVCREALLAVRSGRIAPGRDEKVLAAWNGMMISAMAMAGRELEEPRFHEAAMRAARFLWSELRDESGRLGHSTKDGQPRFPAFLDDVACLLDGLAELAEPRSAAQAGEETGEEAGAGAELLEWAVALGDQLAEHFGDPDGGGFFYTPDDNEPLIARYKDSHDGATPSGNAMAATALLKLSRLTGDDRWSEPGVGCLELISGQLARVPQASGQALLALDDWLGEGEGEAAVEN